MHRRNDAALSLWPEGGDYVQALRPKVTAIVYKRFFRLRSPEESGALLIIGALMNILKQTQKSFNRPDSYISDSLSKPTLHSRLGSIISWMLILIDVILLTALFQNKDKDSIFLFMIIILYIAVLVNGNWRSKLLNRLGLKTWRGITHFFVICILVILWVLAVDKGEPNGVIGSSVNETNTLAVTVRTITENDFDFDVKEAKHSKEFLIGLQRILDQNDDCLAIVPEESLIILPYKGKNYVSYIAACNTNSNSFEKYYVRFNKTDIDTNKSMVWAVPSRLRSMELCQAAIDNRLPFKSDFNLDNDTELRDRVRALDYRGLTQNMYGAEIKFSATCWVTPREEIEIEIR